MDDLHPSSEQQSVSQAKTTKRNHERIYHLCTLQLEFSSAARAGRIRRLRRSDVAVLDEKDRSGIVASWHMTPQGWTHPLLHALNMLLYADSVVLCSIISILYGITIILSSIIFHYIIKKIYALSIPFFFGGTPRATRPDLSPFRKGMPFAPFVAKPWLRSVGPAGCAVSSPSDHSPVRVAMPLASSLPWATSSS